MADWIPDNPDWIPDKKTETEPSFWKDVVVKTGKDVWEGVKAAPEAAATLATGLVNPIVGGYAGLGTLLTGGGLEEAAKNVEKYGLPYQPRGETAQQAITIAMKPFEWIEEASKYYGDKIYEKTEDPVLAASAKTAFDGISYFVLPGMTKSVKTSLTKLAPWEKGINPKDFVELNKQELTEKLQSRLESPRRPLAELSRKETTFAVKNYLEPESVFKDLPEKPIKPARESADVFQDTINRIQSPAGKEALLERLRLEEKAGKAKYELEIKDLREQVNIGEPGKRTLNAMGEPVVTQSTYPSWMQNKGWTKKEVLSAIDKGLSGEKLVVRQQEIFDTVKTEARNQFAEQIRLVQKEKIQPLKTGELEVGDRVRVKGETLKVTDKTPEKITIQNGQKYELDPYFDTIEGKKLTPAKPTKLLPPELEPLAGEEFVYQGVVHPSLESEYVSESLLTAAYHAERMQAIGAPAPGKTGEGVVRVFRKRDIDYSKKTQIGDYKLKDGTKPVKTLTPEEARILNNQAKAGKAKPTKGGETKSGLSSLAEEERRIDQSGKITFGKEKPKPDMDKFENPETESLYKSAVFQPEKLSSRIKDLLTQVKHKFTRTYEHLSNTPENTQLIFDLKRLEKQKEVSADKSARAVGEVLSTLDKKEADIFTRKVFLDDLMDDFNRGLHNKKDLPFKFTLDSLRKELQNKERQISVNPRLQEALTKRKEAWDALKAEYIRELRPYKPDVADMFKKESYYRHEVLDYMVDKGIFGTGKRLKTPYRGYMKGRTGYGGLYNTDFLSAEHNIMSQMLYDIEVAKTLTRIKKIENVEGITKQIKEYAKAQGIKDWHEAIPEGYTAWQPREGNVFYRTLSIPEATMQKIMEGELAGIVELTPELKKVLAMGGKREEWVVREEVAKTLNNLVRERPTGMASRVNREVLTAWKKWQLISPRRYFKYNTRNLTGDAEAVFLGNPSGFKKSPQAFRELWNVFVEKKPMSKDMAAWFDRGGMSSTLQAQEMGALKKTWMFERLYEKKGDFNIWEKYWNTARMSTDFRESILRYANFLDYKEQLLANKGRPKNYGASKPEMVNALKNIDDKAFWLSNDLLGAYDRISVAGSTIRERIIPFWSWQELNAKRYIQLYKNAANDSNLTMTIGKQLGVKSPLIAMKLGRLVIKTTAFTGLLQVWNNLLFPDEERVLPNDIKSNAHIILGKDEKGDILYFNRMGTLDDFISWFGLDYVPAFVRRVLKGEPLKDLLIEQTMKTMQAPINKLAQGAYPFHKLAFETVARRGLFPDVFKPGTIRDRWLHIARSFGLENEYIAMAGKPSKGYGESLKNLILYTIAPGEAAYRNTWDMKHEFLKKLGKGADGFWLTKTGDALYNMKLAIRYGDKEAFSKYFSTYVLEAEKQERDIESIEKGVMQSLKNMHPLSGMKEEELKAFAQTLSEDEKDTVDEAIKFYFETLAPTENF